MSGELLVFPEKIFGLRHPRLGARVVVKAPWWVPKCLHSLYDKNIGKDGCVVSVDKGEYSKCILYSVVFNAEEWPKATVGAYFEEDLEFKTQGIFAKESAA